MVPRCPWRESLVSTPTATRTCNGVNVSGYRPYARTGPRYIFYDVRNRGAAGARSGARAAPAAPRVGARDVPSIGSWMSRIRSIIICLLSRLFKLIL